MQEFKSRKELQQHLVKLSRDKPGKRILVPTMGNLHAGHLALVNTAKQQAGHSGQVIVSIFVNPLQFSAGEDLQSYPRTLEADREKLHRAGVDVLFIPEPLEMYARKSRIQIAFPGMDDILCGQNRPGHFSGVAVVVSKLFHLIQPDMAIFGEKDYQQLMIIRQLVTDLDMNVEIHSVPIMREVDGLAMSSRNNYLSVSERTEAVLLNQMLQQLVQEIKRGNRDYSKLEQHGIILLEEAGWKVDYVRVLDADTLLPVSQHSVRILLPAAAVLGTTRLIDNLCFVL